MSSSFLSFRTDKSVTPAHRATHENGTKKTNCNKTSPARQMTHFYLFRLIYWTMRLHLPSDFFHPPTLGPASASLHRESLCRWLSIASSSELVLLLTMDPLTESTTTAVDIDWAVFFSGCHLVGWMKLELPYHKSNRSRLLSVGVVTKTRGGLCRSSGLRQPHGFAAEIPRKHLFVSSLSACSEPIGGSSAACLVECCSIFSHLLPAGTEKDTGRRENMRIRDTTSCLFLDVRKCTQSMREKDFQECLVEDWKEWWSASDEDGDDDDDDVGLVLRVLSHYLQ